MFYILGLSLLCHLTCFSIPCISCILEVRIKGLIQFRLNIFGKNTVYFILYHHRRHMLSGCSTIGGGNCDYLLLVVTAMSPHCKRNLFFPLQLVICEVIIWHLVNILFSNIHFFWGGKGPRITVAEAGANGRAHWARSLRGLLLT